MPRRTRSSGSEVGEVHIRPETVRGAMSASLYLDAVHPTPLFDEPVKQGIDFGSKRARKGWRQGVA
jgi:hypothetical protein